MGRMYFYDIMMLYNRYDEYLKDEQKAQEEQQRKYEEEHPTPDYSNMASQMSDVTKKIGSITPSSITSGFNFQR
jgi:predicted glycosyl hydrolase (DUF1957 family)